MTTLVLKQMPLLCASYICCRSLAKAHLLLSGLLHAAFFTLASFPDMHGVQVPGMRGTGARHAWYSLLIEVRAGSLTTEGHLPRGGRAGSSRWYRV